MIRYTKGNLLESSAQALVNTVNTVGIMGKGIALQFKRTFPLNYQKYRTACQKGELQPGNLLVVREAMLEGERIIINFPTKTEWFKKSQYEYIESGLKKLVEVIRQEHLSSIALPPLGCGNGGLDFVKVRLLLEKYLSPLEDLEITVYEPDDKVKNLLKTQTSHRTGKLTPTRAMLLYSLYHYEAEGEAASILVANYLAYFLQRLGETLRLNFSSSPKGIDCHQVEALLKPLMGNYLRGFETNPLKVFEPLLLNYEKLEEVKQFIDLQLSLVQKGRLRHLLNLMEGFQSAMSLEMLATVDLVMTECQTQNCDDIVQRVHARDERNKVLMKERHISIAMQHLSQQQPHLKFS